MQWRSPEIRALVALALSEDDARQDITSRLLIPTNVRLKAAFVAKQRGVVCGLPLAAAFFKALAPSARVRPLVREGAVVRPGQAFLRIEGPARVILAAERPALNAVQHLSGIATYTAAQVARLGRGKTQLLDTRKTLPGWRALEKYAVRCGGGKNHRQSLGDAVLVKENHVFIGRAAGIDWVARLRRFRAAKPAFPVQVEIQSWADLKQVVLIRPQRVLVDNQPPATLKKMMAALRRALPGVEIEISGGVRPDDLARLARLNPERISMGRLTHSAPAFDCSLDILHVQVR